MVIGNKCDRMAPENQHRREQRMTDIQPLVIIERGVEGGDAHVATIRLNRPPNNFFSVGLIEAIAELRVVVLAADGKHFCAGADFSGQREDTTAQLYSAAARLFRTRKPIVAAIQGAAVGGGLGLALAADFRIGTPEARLSANFARLGFHHGFGLSVTLPRLVGQQRAAELLYTGRRLNGDDATAIGLLDRLVPLADLEAEAQAFAGEIAGSAPLAVESIRATLRAGLADEIVAATDHEMAEQTRLRATADFAEGTRAMGERRAPNFERR
jgi:2-(1,2-epoxy-1,2-dihydrophenyl)acetyl-CoA isomerase